MLSIDYPYPNLRERWVYDINADTVYCKHQGDSLALIPHGGSTGIGSATVADGMIIDTKVKVCVKFHAADVPDTTRLFNIRNRLYACERIEVTVDSKGKQPMMTGYFFPRAYSSPWKVLVSSCTGRSRPCRYLFVVEISVCRAWSRATTIPASLARSRIPESFNE